MDAAAAAAASFLAANRASKPGMAEGAGRGAGFMLARTSEGKLVSPFFILLKARI